MSECLTLDYGGILEYYGDVWEPLCCYSVPTQTYDDFVSGLTEYYNNACIKDRVFSDYVTKLYNNCLSGSSGGGTGGTGVYVTGGTANGANSTLNFTNSTGGTFTVTNSALLFNDAFVTGGTLNQATGVVTFTNSSGGTFTVSGFDDFASYWSGSSDGTSITTSGSNTTTNVNLPGILGVSGRTFLGTVDTATATASDKILVVQSTGEIESITTGALTAFTSDYWVGNGSGTGIKPSGTTTNVDVTGVLGVTGNSTFGGSILLGDGSVSANYIGVGDNDDLKIFHNGGHSIIRETGTGSLYLQSDNNVIISKDSSTELMVKGIADGAVEIYYDNVKKFETTSAGVNVSGNTLIKNELGVSGRTYLGTIDAAGDSYSANQILVAQGDGEVEYLTTAQLKADIADADYWTGNTDGTSITPSGGTTNTDIKLNGGLTAQTLNISGNTSLGDNDKIMLGADNDLEVYANSSGGRIAVGSSTLQVEGNTLDFTDGSASSYLFRGVASGAVSLYYSGTKKFETTSSGINVSGNTLVKNELGVSGRTYLGTIDAAGGSYSADKILVAQGDGEVEYLTTAQLKADIGDNDYWIGNGSGTGIKPSGTTTNVDVTGVLGVTGKTFISGDVGIGTTDPQKKLDIAGGDIRLDNSKSIFFATTDGNIGRVAITGDESSDFIQLKVDNSNSHILRLNTTGVGIGTSSPTAKLDIDGNVKISGDTSIKTNLGVTGNTYVKGNTFIDGTLSAMGNTTLSGTLDLNSVAAITPTPTSTEVILVKDSAGVVKSITKAQLTGVTEGLYWQEDGTGTGIKPSGTTTNIKLGAGLTAQTLNISGNTILGDNDKLMLGDANDLQIYHDGSNSIIEDNGTGHVQVRSGTFTILNAAGSKTSAIFNSGSEQAFYYDDVQKLETTSTGINVSGSTLNQGNLGVTGVTYSNVVSANTQHIASTLGISGRTFLGTVDAASPTPTSTDKILVVQSTGEIESITKAQLTGFTENYWSSNTDSLSISPSGSTDILLSGGSSTTYPLTIERDNNGNFLKFRDKSHIQQDYTLESESSGTFYGLNLKNKDGDTIVNFAANQMLGVGTIDPTVAVDIDSGLMAADALQVRIAGKGGIGHTNAGQSRTIIGNSYKHALTRFGVTMGGYTTGDELLTIMGTGDVGIGTADAASGIRARLHVSGSTILTDSLGVSGNTNINGVLSGVTDARFGGNLGVSGRTFLGTVDTATATASDKILVVQSTGEIESITTGALTAFTSDYWIGNGSGTGIKPSGTTTNVDVTGILGVSGKTFLTGLVGVGTTTPDSLVEIASSSVTDFLKLTSEGSSANPIKLIFEKGASEQGIIEYNRNGDLEIYNTDGDGGVMIDGSASAGGDLYVANSGNVGVKTTNPSVELDVNGSVKITGNTLNQGNLGVTGVTYSNIVSANTQHIASTLGISGRTYLGTIDAAGASYSNDKILVAQSNGEVEYLTTAQLKADIGDNDYWVGNGSGTGVKPSGTTTNVDVTGVLGVSGKTNITGDLDVDGTSNLDAVDIDGNVQLDGTLTVGVDDTGYDVKFFGDTASSYMLWDTSEDRLEVGSDTSPKIRLNRSGTGQVWQQEIDSSGRFQLKEAASAGGTLYVRLQIDDTGEVDLYNTLTVGGGDVIISGDTFNKGNLGVTGNTYVKGNTFIDGTLSAMGNTTLTGTLDLNSVAAITPTPTSTEVILVKDTSGVVKSITKAQLTGITEGLYWEEDGTGTGIKPSGATTNIKLGGGLTAQTLNISGNTILGDNDKIMLGADNDLEIYSDSTNGRIAAGSGVLQIEADTLDFTDGAATEYYIRCVANGSVSLYHDANKKFETTAAGINVSGNTLVKNELGVSGKTYLGDIGAAGDGYSADKILVAQGDGEVEYLTTAQLKADIGDNDYWQGNGSGTGIKPSGTTTNVDVTGQLGVSGDTTISGDILIGSTNKLANASATNTHIQLNINQMLFDCGGVEMMRMSQTSGTIFNIGGGAGLDFTIEGDTDPGLFFVDAGADKVSIGTTTVSEALLTVDGDTRISGDTFSKGNLGVTGNTYVKGNTFIDGTLSAMGNTTLSGTLDLNSVAAITPTPTSDEVILVKDTAGVVKSITKAQLTGVTSDYWVGNGSGTGIKPSGGTVNVDVTGQLGVSGDTTISGDLFVAEYIKHAGDSDTFIQFADDSIGINAGNEQLITISESPTFVKIGDGGDVDFQVRTNSDDNTLYVEGSTDNVGIGTNTPTVKLDVNGSVRITGDTFTKGNLGVTGNTYVKGNTYIDGTLSAMGNTTITGDLDVDGTSNLDNTDIDGTLVVDGTNISLDSTSTLNIDNSNTTNGITIGTATSAVPISIGHTTSETTINDNLTVTGTLDLDSVAAITPTPTSDEVILVKDTSGVVKSITKAQLTGVTEGLYWEEDGTGTGIKPSGTTTNIKLGAGLTAQTLNVSGMTILDSQVQIGDGNGRVTIAESDGDIVGYETADAVTKAYMLSNHTQGGKLSLYNAGTLKTLFSYNADSYINVSSYGFVIGATSTSHKFEVKNGSTLVEQFTASELVTAQGNINISGDTFNKGNLGVTGNTYVKGNTFIDGTLSAMGNTTLSGTLDLNSVAAITPTPTSTEVILVKDTAGVVKSITKAQLTGVTSDYWVGNGSGTGIKPSGTTTNVDVTGVLGISGNTYLPGNGSIIFDNGEATMTHSGSGDFTIDVADDIRLDAGGGDVVLRAAGTEYGRLTNSSGALVINNITENKNILFKGNDDNGTSGVNITALELDMSEGGAAVFNDKVTAGSNGFVVGNATLTTSELDISSGDFTLDVEGDITLDANGADIILSDDGTDFGRFKRDASHFIIKAETNNKDIIFRGQDAASTIDALLLDMSEAGSATFNRDVNVSGVTSGRTDARFGGDLSVTGRTFLGTVDTATATASDKILVVQSNGEIESITTAALTAFTSDYWVGNGTGTGIKPSGTTTNVDVIGQLGVSGETLFNGKVTGNGDFKIENLIVFETGSTSANTYIGYQAGNPGQNTTQHQYNTAIGYQALYSQEGGQDVDGNTAIGYKSLYSITTGEWNTGIGEGALRYTTTQNGNTAIGKSAMGNSVATSGQYNVVVGYLAGYNVKGTGNLFFGIGTGAGNNGGSNTGGDNVGMGNYSVGGGSSAGVGTLTSGDRNLGVGSNALGTLTSGNDNIGIGSQAGDAITSGDFNIVIGPGQDVPSATGDYQMNIGGIIHGKDLQMSTGEIQISGNTILTNDLGVSGDTNINGTLSAMGNTTIGGTLDLDSVATTTPTPTSAERILVKQTSGVVESITKTQLTGLTDFSSVATYWQGNGSGTGIKPSGTTTNVDVTGVLGVSGKTNITGDLDVDGTSNLDAVDIDGNVQLDGTFTVGVDDTGYDVKFFGATSGKYMLWDEDQDSLDVKGILNLEGGTTAAAPTPQLHFGNYYDSSGGPSISHIDLYNGDYGFGISVGDLDYISDIRHRFYSDTSAAADGTPALQIDGENNQVGVNMASASYSLDVTGDIRINSGALGVGVNPNGTDGRIDASNDVVAYSSSDKRWKENIQPIENALDKVSQISGVEFDWKKLTKEEKKTQHGNEGHDIGVIAQEIEKVLPEIVITRENGYKGVRYEKIVPLLIESIKELKAEIEELKNK